MRTVSCAVLAVLASSIALSVVRAGEMEVTIDASSKTGATDSPGVAAKEIYLRQKLLRAYLVNETRSPGEAVAKVVGLPPAASGCYDLYVDRKLIGSRSADDLAKGFAAPLRGATIDEADLSFVNRVERSSKDLVESLKDYTTGDGKMVRDLCNQVNGWCKVFIRQEERSRSTEIFVSPSGEPLAKFPPDTRLDKAGMRQVRERLFDDTAGVRRVLAGRLIDPYFADLAAKTLIPTDFAIKELPAPCPGCRKFLLTLTNRADKPVAVKLRIEPADGLTAKPTGESETATLDRGQSLSCGFVLTGSVAKNAIEPNSFAVARVTLEKSAFSAREKIPG